MNLRNFFSELKRRNVYKVAVAYAIVSWLLIQAASILFPTFDAPPWVMKVFVAVLVFGFPAALVLAWAFEITPEGIKLESEVSPNESITRRTGRKIIGLSVVVAIIAAGLLAFQLWGPKRTPAVTATFASAPPVPVPEKSIAVLPFENLSSDKENAYFAEGIQDEILTRLSKIAALKVISRTSTQHFKSSPENLPQIAQQLGVANILEGSVQREPNEVRVNVQLIKAATDAHLWADIYDRKLTDMFAVESDIAKTIADTLRAKLTGSEERAMSSKPTQNPEAYQLYLKGRFFWNKRTGADLRKSLDYFNQAIAKDPDYALAYAASAEAWVVFPAYDAGSPNDCFPQAEIAAKKALALDDNLSEGHSALGAVQSLYTFQFLAAVAEYERAIQLNPNDATAHHWLANDCYANLGRSDQEVAEMKRALELDPLSLIINANLGVSYLHNGQLDEAIAQLRRTVEMGGDFYYARYQLAVALELEGANAEAMAELQKTVAITGDPVPLGYLGNLEAKLGRKDEAQKILRQLLHRREQRYTEAYCLAVVYLGLGDRADAIKWLTRGYEEHDGFDLGGIRVDPMLAPLRNDPSFQALAEKIVPAREFGKAAPAL